MAEEAHERAPLGVGHERRHQSRPENRLQPEPKEVNKEGGEVARKTRSEIEE